MSIGANGQLQITGGGQVTGTLIQDPTAKVQLSGGSAIANTIVESTAQIQSAAIAEANLVASLIPTQNVGAITHSTTITGTGGRNVIAVSQVNLQGGSTLTISGGPNDSFFFQVAQGFTLGGGSKIVLNGVSPNNVLWYFPGSGPINTNGNSDTQGIFLGLTVSVTISGGVHNSEFISGANMTFQSGPHIASITPCAPSGLALACPASTGTVNTPYSSSLAATGGTPPYTFSIVTGALPAGLTLNPSTGAITGTPTTPGTFSFTAEVTDSTSGVAQTKTSTCTITISNKPPYVCVIPPSGTAISGAPVSWNGFKAPAGSVVWINAHLSPSGVPTNTITTVAFTGVTLVVNATTYALPNGTVVFNPSVSTPTTAVNGDGSWTTTVNPSTGGNIFFVGQAIPVDANMENGGGGNTNSTLSFTTNSSDNALKFQWQWGAAVYTSWLGNAAAEIEPVDAGQHAGAPLNPQIQQTLIQGPRGGGGSNFTGSWSGTGQGTCPGAH